MALLITIVDSTDTGQIASAYSRITALSVDYLRKVATIQAGTWRSRAGAAAGKDPILSSTVYIYKASYVDPNGVTIPAFDDWVSQANAAHAAIRLANYAILQTLPQWATSTQAPETP